MRRDGEAGGGQCLDATGEGVEAPRIRRAEIEPGSAPNGAEGVPGSGKAIRLGPGARQSATSEAHRRRRAVAGIVISPHPGVWDQKSATAQIEV